MCVNVKQSMALQSFILSVLLLPADSLETDMPDIERNEADVQNLLGSLESQQALRWVEGHLPEVNDIIKACQVGYLLCLCLYCLHTFWTLSIIPCDLAVFPKMKS